MNVGAIGGYSAYIPYTSSATAAAASFVHQPSEAGMNGDLSKVNGDSSKIDGSSSKKVDKTSPSYECETCAERKYQDGSDEMDVSFKSASRIAPEAAASAVRNHEQQHVSNAYQKAGEENGKVLSASVSIHTSICPECGRTYVSGGTTKTSIKYTNEDNPYQKGQKSLDGSWLRGMNFDMTT